MGIKSGVLILAIGLGLGAQAHAMDIHVSGDSCGYRTDYDVHVTDAGIGFDRDSGTPHHVFMHGGQIRIDGKPLAVSSDDAERLRQYETQVRALLPEVASIAREGLDIGFGAIATVTATFAEDPADRKRMLDKINVKRAAAMREIDQGIASGVWKQDELQRTVEEGVGTAVSELVGTVTAGAVSAALSGDQSKVAALEARANSLDATIDKEVNARADKLGHRAEALCPRMQALDDLQKHFSFRLSDGSSLKLISPDPDHHGKVVASF
jgi:hypothetical protein